jgi:tetratricopeptide (TPR) repeat protein
MPLQKEPSRMVTAGYLAALLIAAACVFGPVVFFEFVRWDDDINITQNTLITEGWSWSAFGHCFDSSTTLRFKPLHWILYKMIYGLFGLEPGAWHSFNLVLHTLAGALFFLVLREIFARTHPALTNKRREGTAFLAAMFWMVHPLRSEVVAWCTASTYALAALGALFSFLCYLKAYQQGPNGIVDRRWLGLSWVGALAAFASYPVAAGYAAWLVAADFWLLNRGPKNEKSWWLKHAMFSGPAALIVLLTAYSRIATPGIFRAAPTLETVDVGSRALMAFANLGDLIARVLKPGYMTPNVMPISGSLAHEPKVIASALFAGILVIACWIIRKRWSGGPLLGLGFVGLSLPCLGLTEQPTWLVDRYTYVAHLALVGSMAAAGLSIVRTKTKLWVAGALGVAFFCALQAYRQTQHWRNDDKLFSLMEAAPDFLAEPTQAGHIYVLWARSSREAGQYEVAAHQLNRAQQVYVDSMRDALKEKNHGRALVISMSMEQYFDLTPELHRERAAWLLELGRYQEAKAILAGIKSLLPNDARLDELSRRATEGAAGAER